MIINVSNASGKSKIEKVPSVASTLIYNAKEQSPTWLGYDSEQLEISGITSAINAGTYAASFTPTSRYKWEDGSSEAKTVEWVIEKAATTITLSSSSGIITGKNNKISFTVSKNSNGEVKATSNNTGVATVSVSGTTVTITSKAYGTTTISVYVGEDTNYKASSTKTFTVTVDYQYLYKYGTEYTNFTGVLTPKAQALEEGTDPKKPYISKGGSSFTISMSNNGSGTQGVGGTVYWEKKIDLTNYNNIRFEGSFDSGAWDGVAVWSSMSGYVHTNRVASVNTLSSGIGNINISSLQGEYYIGFWVYYNGTQLTCKSIRLE